MHSAKDQVHSEICDEHAQESDNGVNMEDTRVSEGFEPASLKRHQIYQQGNQSPRLFGVPSPVAAPGDISPYSPYECPECEQEDARVECREAQVLKPAGGFFSA